MRRAEHRVGRHGLAPHQLPVARAGVAEVDQHLAHQLAVDRDLAVLDVPARSRRGSGRARASGAIAASSAVEEAHRAPGGACRPSASPSMPSRIASTSASTCSRPSFFVMPKSRNATRPSGMQHVVARMGVAGEVPVAVERAEEEAEHDLAEAVALLLRQLAHLLEADPLDPLGHQHALARQRRDDVGDHDERMAAPGARERALGLRLLLVVELLGQPLADLRRPSPWRPCPGAIRLATRMIRPRFCRSDAHRLGDARVLDLHRHVAPVVRAWRGRPGRSTRRRSPPRRSPRTASRAACRRARARSPCACP